MPIRRDLRHLYRGAEYRARRSKILARAGGRCEQCGKPDRARLLVARDRTGRWRRADRVCRWRDSFGRPVAPPRSQIFEIRCLLTVAHLDHNPQHNEPVNLKALCQRCHLVYDAEHHAQTAYATRRQGRAVADLFDDVQ